MAKCCNYTDNTSPTLDQCKAIESNWNKFVNDFFKEIDDKYPDTDLTKIDLGQGTKLLQSVSTGEVKRHPTTDRPMYRVMTGDLKPVEIVDEELSVLRLISLLVDEEDGILHHNIEITLNSARMVIATATGGILLEDRKEDENKPDEVTSKGLKTLLAANKVTLRTHQGHMQYGGYEREELRISYP